MAPTPSLNGDAAAGGEQKQRDQDDGSEKNGRSPANQGPKKPPKRGWGAFQLDQLLQREQRKKRASGDQGAAAASRSALLPLPHPSFLDPLTGTPLPYPPWHQEVGAYSPAAGSDPHHFSTMFGASSGGRGGGTVIPDQAAVAPYSPSCYCNGLVENHLHSDFVSQGPSYTLPNQVGATFDDDQAAAYLNILECWALLGSDSPDISKNM